MATVLRAVMEVRRPSIFGELIIALTFLPIITLRRDGGEDVLPSRLHRGHRPFCLAVPVDLHYPCAVRLLPQARGGEARTPPGWIRRVYLPGSRWTLRHDRFSVVSLGGLLVIGGLAMLPRLGTEFIPVMDEGAFDMDFQLIPGVSLDKAMEITSNGPETAHGSSRNCRPWFRAPDRPAFRSKREASTRPASSAC